ncbi:formylglycine-generating enzyme family protein [Pseudoalteromonas luteoviolacea]|uniref:Sulfatase-modifying factor enzyme-like domain-containing protein n=1 Tax=Pseudoalteromonas luteoviolacea H33 TaxID=1365251 RepID=A0A162AMR5_9GAMM|nr:SUMF1/EgtB/PvdO family nonheme iron enzyme [Pseudoalteromonas luteoviolacea]KZN52567.1 hypothetical protein N476_10920 [Pseudoalteromonas luteoviolacea H33]KZN76501.1 hypothetical protein N477_15435 [Pseudoalteromonas luteoviolacea H33-S]
MSESSDSPPKNKRIDYDTPSYITGLNLVEKMGRTHPLLRQALLNLRLNPDDILDVEQTRQGYMQTKEETNRGNHSEASTTRKQILDSVKADRVDANFTFPIVIVSEHHKIESINTPAEEMVADYPQLILEKNVPRTMSKSTAIDPAFNIWREIERALTFEHLSQQLDIKANIKQVSEYRPLEKLIFKQSKKQLTSITLYIDSGGESPCLVDDIKDFMTGLKRKLGVNIVAHSYWLKCFSPPKWGEHLLQVQSSMPPITEGNVIILADPKNFTSEFWQVWLKQVERQASHIVKIGTRPSKGWVYWGDPRDLNTSDDQALKILKAILATTPQRITPAMIRALRTKLTGGSIAIEQSVMSWSQIRSMPASRVMDIKRVSGHDLEYFSELNCSTQQRASAIISQHLPENIPQFKMLHYQLMAMYSPQWRAENSALVQVSDNYFNAVTRAGVLSHDQFSVEEICASGYQLAITLAELESCLSTAIKRQISLANNYISKHCPGVRAVKGMDEELYDALKYSDSLAKPFKPGFLIYKNGKLKLVTEKKESVSGIVISIYDTDSCRIYIQDESPIPMFPGHSVEIAKWPITIKNTKQSFCLSKENNERFYWADSLCIDEDGVTAETDFITVTWSNSLSDLVKESEHYLNAEVMIKDDAPTIIKCSKLILDKYGLKLIIPIQIDPETINLVMRYIPPGSFLMGSPEGEYGRFSSEQQTVRRVNKGFWLGETVVTQALWQEIMDNNPSHFTSDQDAPRRPVEKVNWQDCHLFCEALNSKVPGLNVSLPDEIHWEYACRAGTQSAHWWGNKPFARYANFGAKKGRTVDATHYPPNPWGLYQMHGNVWEWCQNLWVADLTPWENTSLFNAFGSSNLSSDSQFALRGGAWDSEARSIRSANRNFINRDSKYGDTGFRVAIFDFIESGVLGSELKKSSIQQHSNQKHRPWRTPSQRRKRKK